MRRKTRLGKARREQSMSARAETETDDGEIATADAPSADAVAEEENASVKATSEPTTEELQEDAGAEPNAIVFTDADWEDQSYSLIAEGADPPPCPECGRTGFYGPRALDGVPKFRACRFCGFFQEVGGEPTRLRAVAHDCEQWPQCAGAPYVWWIPMDQKWYTCNFCSRRTAVEAANPFMKSAAITAPSDDPNHPWWKIPQNAPYDAYYKFWEQWPSTKGRAIF